jgi:hypothetical protein
VFLLCLALLRFTWILALVALLLLSLLGCVLISIYLEHLASLVFTMILPIDWQVVAWVTWCILLSMEKTAALSPYSVPMVSRVHVHSLFLLS